MPWTLSYSRRTLKRPCRINGQNIARYIAPIITEYVDTETGEILPAAEAMTRGAWPEIRLGERMALREAALTSLRPEVRQFAYFVLLFRNRRRGITPGLDTLAKWYADIHGKRPEHIRRYIPRMQAAGVVINQTLLGDVFQISGKYTPTRDHAGEEAYAACQLAAYYPQSLRTQEPESIQDAPCTAFPAWLPGLLARIRPALYVPSPAQA